MHDAYNLTASCPECQNDLSFNRRPQLGYFVFCPECETTSEVIEVEPIKLDWYFEEPFNEDEDYDDDYDDEDYDDDYDDENDDENDDED